MNQNIKDFERLQKRRFYMAIAFTIVPVAIGMIIVLSSYRLKLAFDEQTVTLQQKVDSLKTTTQLLEVLSYEKRLELDSLTGNVEKLSKWATIYRSRFTSLLYRNALDHLAAKEFSKAVVIYDSILSVNPNDFVAFTQKGFALLSNGDADAAVPVLERAVSIQNNYLWSHYNLALAYFSTGRPDDALKQLDASLYIEPSVKEDLRNDYLLKRFMYVKGLRELLNK